MKTKNKPKNKQLPSWQKLIQMNKDSIYRIQNLIQKLDSYKPPKLKPKNRIG